ncbi:hypothetical protein CPSG_06347 [Coccidioides posadasii str. Silveira]|uniref:Amine oxidase domain-containing protein n=2 Tax=Coccidioides posadasii (strain RMSCC 757 / Silveira) TaxID=443226 RepID=E9D945_COCPS|nr:hypothetical protein CPSG_06347 [Coccidioides posadasii str. Silveira]
MSILRLFHRQTPNAKQKGHQMVFTPEGVIIGRLGEAANLPIKSFAMGSAVIRFLPLFGLALLKVPTSSALSIDKEVITADVCIIGGGSTGTYAGVKLKDEGKKVAIVERNDYLGGHIGTLYVDGEPVDYGVQGFFNTETTTKYLNRLNVQYEPLLPATLDNRYVDFRTGKTAPYDGNVVNITATLLLYSAVVSKFEGIADGSFNLPDQVPDELLMPFGQFVQRYHLEGALPLVWTFAHGSGNMLTAPTLYVLQLFGQPHVNALLRGYVRAKRGTAEVYKKAAEVLGSDVIYNSQILKVTRSDSGVTVVVRTKDDKFKQIRAKKLLVTMVPTLRNLDPFDLDQKEESVFRQWMWKNYYVGIVKNSGLPEKASIVDVDPTKAASLPHMPFVWHLDYMGVPGYHAVKIVGDSEFTESEAKDLVFGGIRRMGAAGTFPISNPELATWRRHIPLTLAVSNEAVKGGFYRDLYALQGHKNTFYTGLSFCSDYSTLLWDFTNKVLEQMDV